MNGISHCQAFTMREISFAGLLRWEGSGSPALEDRRIVSLTGSHNSCLETYQWSDKDASSTSWARKSLQCRLPGAEAALLLSAFLSSFCYLPHDFSSPGTVPAHQIAHTFRVLQESLQRPRLLELPPCATFISPSVHSGLGHIPFSKPQLCFLIRHCFVSKLSHCLPTSPFLILPGCVLTQTWAPFPASLHFKLPKLSHMPCC